MVDSTNLNRLQLIRFCGMIQKTKNERWCCQTRTLIEAMEASMYTCSFVFMLL